MRDLDTMAEVLRLVRLHGGAQAVQEGRVQTWKAGGQALNVQAVGDLLADGWLTYDGKAGTITAKDGAEFPRA